VGETQRVAFERRAADLAIGERLALLRQRARLRQVDVAKAMGWSQSRVTKHEIGARRLALRDGIALAKLYGVTLNDLDPATDPRTPGPNTT
jgi:transcriptional regulator with XRE-family HTH domain